MNNLLLSIIIIIIQILGVVNTGDRVDIIAQIFGLGAMFSLFLIYQRTSRKKMIIAKLSADVCWVVHYLTLGGIAGMIPNAVGVFRELVFINRKRKKWASIIIWPFVFVLINWALGITTFHSVFNVLPIVASTFVTISLWIDNPRLTKIISFPVSVAFMVYDIYVGSYVGIANEIVSMTSIIIYFLKERRTKMKNNVFSTDYITTKPLNVIDGAKISDVASTITASVGEIAVKKGEAFALEITEHFVSDFEKPVDKMAHVSTFKVINGVIYVTYYANTKEPSEDPKNQTVRFVYAPIDEVENKVFFDLQTTGDVVGDKTIDMVYDCILMQKDENTLYIMWTASAKDGNYYRFYCPFNITTKTLGQICINKFKVGNIVNDLSISGIKSALAENDIPCKNMIVDIGIMQKQSYRVENGIKYCYTGLYNGYFNCIIKSSDLITWEYVSQPDFINDSLYENATYVLGDKVFYFVRQIDANKCGFLTAYNILTDTWDKAIEIEDCQSRSDFILYNGDLFLFHAPIDREHIGIVKVDTKNIENSQVVLQAKMHTSCFYPFVQYFDDQLAMSYTVERKHIRLAKFNLKNYL